MIPLTEVRLRSFAERGYVVVPNVVSRDLIEAGMQNIDGPSGSFASHFSDEHCA